MLDRGRGDSRDTLPYSIQPEFEEVAAAVDQMGGPVDVLSQQ